MKPLWIRTLWLSAAALLLAQPVIAQNLSVTTQQGWNNRASTMQSGFGNMAVTMQHGGGNAANTVQSGFGNVAGIVQVGTNHQQTTVQTGRFQSSTSFQVNAPAGRTVSGSRTVGSGLTSATVSFSAE